MTTSPCRTCGLELAAGTPACPRCGRPTDGVAAPTAAPAVPSSQTTEPLRGAGRPGAAWPVAPTPPVPGYPGTAPVPPVPHPGAARPAAAPATVGRRFLAALVDAVVLGIVPVVVLVASGFDLTPEAGATPSVPVLPGVVGLVLWLALVAWEGTTGRTVGKSLLGLRTVDADTGRPIGFGRALLRLLIVDLAGIVLAVGSLVVVLSPAFDRGPRRQGWHDKATRAMVLDERASSGFAPPAPVAAATAPGAPAAPWAPAGPSGAYPAAGAPSGSAAYPSPVPGGAGYAVPAPGAQPAGGFRPVGANAAPPTIGVPTVTPPAPAEGVITGVPRADGWAPSPTTAGTTTAGTTTAGGAVRATTPYPAVPSFPGAGAPPTAPAPSQPVPLDAAPPSRPVPSYPAPSHPVPGRPAVELDLGDGRRVGVVGPTLVGRDPVAASSADATPQLVALDDPARSVSKTHAALDVDARGLWVTDRGSTNGTFVEGPAGLERVAPGARVLVAPGAVLRFGELRVVVVDDTPDETTMLSPRGGPGGRS